MPGEGYGDDFWLDDEQLDSNNQVPVSHRGEGLFRQIIGWLAYTNRRPGAASFFEDVNHPGLTAEACIAEIDRP